MSRWERLLAWEDEHRFAVDCVFAGVLLLVVLPGSVVVNGSLVRVPNASGLPITRYAFGSFAAGLALCTAVAVPLAWRRVAPAPSAGVVYGVVLAQMLFLTPVVLPLDFLVLVALYSATVHSPLWARRTALWGAIAGSGLVTVLLLQRSNDVLTPFAAGTFAFLMVLAVWAFALARRGRMLRLEALVDRARQAEVDRDRQAQLATSAERARIAREMHDIVAHSLSVIIAQADGGRYAAAANPQAPTHALETIGEIGRAALTDMRRLLGVLRTDGPHDEAPGIITATPGTGSVAVAPQPAEGDLEDLVAQLRGAGMRVSLARVGTPRNLPPGAGLTVFRIAQESLTNVLKHAGPDPNVTVLLAWRPEAVVLEVADDGRGAAADSDGAGQGLVGMRERTAMFGGTLSAGPRPGGGFRVRAEIPTPRGVS
ncbi:MAG: sensor histidine kinase [Cellulomonas sp. 73-92]|uniref:sensor histidine kinase n=1 Tax=Cellulomonas sp. 73-92 TaxID=1895740 RepID=UPI000927ADA6|nr:sensor histidine kinase [Cellulomonas sp. 73-92]OJV82147.1 MAG: sensor histidine kinase [Cellulomonas sp. 73-92]